MPYANIGRESLEREREKIDEVVKHVKVAAKLGGSRSGGTIVFFYFLCGKFAEELEPGLWLGMDRIYSCGCVCA